MSKKRQTKEAEMQEKMAEALSSPFGQPIAMSECEHDLCDDCGEPLVFFLQTTDETIIPVDLKTILTCLKTAADHGHIPEIPMDWWLTIVKTYK